MKTRGTPVHRLRSDNGGEYAGHQTIELLEEHGVKGSNGSRRHHITRVKMELQSDVFAPF